MQRHIGSGNYRKQLSTMQSTRDVTIRVQSVNKLHGYLNIGDNGTAVYFAYPKVLSETNQRRE